MKHTLAFALALSFIFGVVYVNEHNDAQRATAAAEAKANAERERKARIDAAYARYLAHLEAERRQQAVLDSLWAIEDELLRMRMQEQMRPIR